MDALHQNMGQMEHYCSVADELGDHLDLPVAYVWSDEDLSAVSTEFNTGISGVRSSPSCAPALRNTQRCSGEPECSWSRIARTGASTPHQERGGHSGSPDIHHRLPVAVIALRHEGAAAEGLNHPPCSGQKSMSGSPSSRGAVSMAELHEPLLPLILRTLDLAPVVRTARTIAGGPPLGNDALGNLRRSACIEGLQKWKRTRWGILVLFGSECFGEQTAYLIDPAICL